MTRQIDHIGIAVNDLEQALEFWDRQLGIRCAHIEELPERGVRVAMLPVGDTRIELLAPLGDKSEIAAALAKRGPGLHHLCLRSDDVDADLTSLAAAGVRLIDERGRPGAGGCRVGFVHPKGSGGVLLELSQPEPR
ncbi:MAG: methylmalonyl-CoA epimerase [Deltaproteobacteria bacterium]|nr:methylmalonyl-CoA epimerase [Deltaproteobacteria bacterium]